MTHIVPSAGIVGETISLEDAPEGLVEIPPALEECFMEADRVIHGTFSFQVERVEGPFFLHYRLTTTHQTICHMHFKEDCIEAFFPPGCIDLLGGDEPCTVENTQHGEGCVVVRFTDVADLRRVLFPAAVLLFGQERSSVLNKVDLEHEGRHFKPLAIEGVTFEDVIGLRDAKGEINRRMILPFDHPEVYSKYGLEAGGGILLHGPPGNGKTLLAKAVANELGLPFFSLSRSDLVETYVGVTEKSVRNLFGDIGEYPAAVLFIDECESIFPRRGNPHAPWDSALTDEFLVALDGVKGKGCRLLLIGATNMPWLMDPAMLRPGRLDVCIYVGDPDEDDRVDLLTMYLRKAPLGDDMNVFRLSDMCEGWSCAEIRGLVDLAKSLRAELEIDGTDGEQTLLMKDLERAYEMIGGKKTKGEEKKGPTTDDPIPNEEQKYVADPEKRIPGYW